MTARYESRWAKWSCPCGGRVVAVDGASPHCARCARLKRESAAAEERRLARLSREAWQEDPVGWAALAEQVEAGWRAFWAKRNLPPPRIGSHDGGLTL